MMCHLLHLPIDGVLLSHEGMTKDDVVEMIIEHLGADQINALKEVTGIKGAHARFSYVRWIFKEHLFQQLEVENEGDMEEVRKLRAQALRI